MVACLYEYVLICTMIGWYEYLTIYSAIKTIYIPSFGVIVNDAPT